MDRHTDRQRYRERRGDKNDKARTKINPRREEETGDTFFKAWLITLYSDMLVIDF